MLAVCDCGCGRGRGRGCSVWVWAWSVGVECGRAGVRVHVVCGVGLWVLARGRGWVFQSHLWQRFKETEEPAGVTLQQHVVDVPARTSGHSEAVLSS